MQKITVSDMLERVLDSSGGWLLIGGTRAGRGLFCELKKRNKEGLITFWTDKKYNFYRLAGLPMNVPNEISNHGVNGIILSSDYVEKFYLTISDKYDLNGIAVYEMFGNADNMGDFEWKDPKYTDLPANPSDLICVNPLDLISEKRLDIVIRYMACKQMMGINDFDIDMVDVYKKLTLSMNDGEEFVRPFTTCSYFSDYKQKKGTGNFIDDLTSLIKSMHEKGFDKKHYIPLSETCGVINGTHRVAAALALNIPVYAKVFIGFGEPFLLFGRDDLKRIGCSEDQIKVIENEFKKLKKES